MNNALRGYPVRQFLSLCLLLVSTGPAAAGSGNPSMLAAPPDARENAWIFEPLLTIGDAIGPYTPPGIPDGIGVLPGADAGTVEIYLNHELDERYGYPYRLANGTRLTGARISRLIVDRKTGEPVSAGLAYARIIDRRGQPVAAADQINERDHDSAGLAKLCSARMVASGTRGFVDNIYMTGEETSRSDSHGHGGSAWMLDTTAGTLWAAPDLGRGAWENMTPVQAAGTDRIALLMGNDTPGAPLYLYIGMKQAEGGFLQRNGLSGGRLYCWQADDGAASSTDFHGTGQSRNGRFLPLTTREPAHAGRRGYDEQGYLDGDTLYKQALGAGCFSFSRPEDLHDDPFNPARAVFSSTGRIGRFPKDIWGTLYTVDIDTERLTARLEILYDSDDKAHRNAGIRSPDNLTWALNGNIYVQEDNAVGFGMFGANGTEASIWELHPASGNVSRIAVINRNTVLPVDGHDRYAGRTGAWESSGIIDVSRWFADHPGQTVLLASVQAHGIRDGRIGGKRHLVQSGQVLLLRNHPLSH